MSRRVQRMVWALGIVSVAGVKYTTARAVAEQVTDTVARKLQRSTARCRTAATPLPGGDLVDIGAETVSARREHGDLASSTISHLVAAYGSRYRQVLELTTGRAEWRDWESVFAGIDTERRTASP